MYFSDDSDVEMFALLPLLLAEEDGRRREANFRQFVPTISPASATQQVEPMNSDLSKDAALDKALLHLLETGRFSDVQFQVGMGEYCFNCHKAIVGGRSEVLAIAMEQRWTENGMEINVVPNKTVIRLPETDVRAFKVFLKYIYSDELDLALVDGNYIDKLDLLLKVMSLSHMYQVEGLLKECVTQLTTKINVRTCWMIYKKSRLIAPTLSEKSFKFLCENIHEAAAGNEYLKWDGETVQRILSLNRSFISELNLFVALLRWQQYPTDLLEPSRKVMFEESLLPLIRFPSMNLATFTKVIGTKVLPLPEARRLRRYIVNPNPRKRNTSVYNNLPRFVDIFPFRLTMYTKKCRTTACNDDGWYSSADNFMNLIDSQRAEFSIETNSLTTISGLTLYSVSKWDSDGNRCRYNLKITFYIYIGQTVMHKEERSVMIGGPSYAGSLIPFVLRHPFQMQPGCVYEFHVLYTLLEDDPDMVDENETYEYEVTWSIASALNERIIRKVGHGIVFKINYKVEEEEEEDIDDIDHDQTPRWIYSVDFKGKVSQNTRQYCSVS